MNMGARIWCAVCHAMPYPPKGSSFPQDFDLSKISGEWRCSRHRDVKAEAKAKPATSERAELESLLDELGRFVTTMGADEDDRKAALELIDRMGALLTRLGR
jgi:hypothetical protein